MQDLTTAKLSDADLDAIVLRAGSHTARSDGVCFMEAVAWFAGRPHTDRPECVSLVLGAFGRTFNDRLPDDKRRTQLLKPYIHRVVGTRADPDTEIRRVFLVMDWIIREYTPTWLELKPELRQHADTLRALAPINGTKDLAAAQPLLNAAQSAAFAARDAASDAAWDVACDAARTGAWDAASDAVWDGAWDAAMAAAWTAACDATRDAAWTVAWDAAMDAASDAVWDVAWDVAWTAACDATRDTVGAAAHKIVAAMFKPMIERLQNSSMQLFERMIDVA